MSGWLTATPTPVTVSVNTVPTKEIQHRTYDYRVLTRMCTTTVTEYWAMTEAAANALAASVPFNTQTIDAWGFVSYSSQAGSQRQNDCGAYKVVRTEMSVALTVGSWINNPT